MKKIITVLCAFVCILSLTACGQEDSQIQYEKQVLEADLSATLQLVPMLAEEENYDVVMDYSEFEWMSLINTVKTNYGVVIEKTTLVSAVDSYRSAMEEIDDISEVGEVSYDISGKEAIVTLPLIGGTGREANYVITVNADNEVTGCQTDVKYTMSEKMNAAGINTMIGMGTVFLVLILISLLISCFRIIPIIQEKVQKKNAGSNQAMDATIAQIAEKEDEELSEDTELVAVIAAAIASYEGAASTDGFTVRSIRKVNVSKWKNSLK